MSFNISSSDPTVLGCKLLFYPGAFNMTTGPVHWEPLIRARYFLTFTKAFDFHLKQNWKINAYCHSYMTLLYPIFIESQEAYVSFLCFAIADIVFVLDFKHQK